MKLDGAPDELYCFQFPSPFPKFGSSEVVSSIPPDDPQVSLGMDAKGKAKTVSWASDVKNETKAGASAANNAAQQQGGIIGNIQIRRSGAVSIVLGDGMPMEVGPRTRRCILQPEWACTKVLPAVQTSFAQQVVQIDPERLSAFVLGQLKDRYVVVPDISLLLAELSAKSVQAKVEPELEGLEVL